MFTVKTLIFLWLLSPSARASCPTFRECLGECDRGNPASCVRASWFRPEKWQPMSAHDIKYWSDSCDRRADPPGCAVKAASLWEAGKKKDSETLFERACSREPKWCLPWAMLIERRDPQKARRLFSALDGFGPDPVLELIVRHGSALWDRDSFQIHGVKLSLELPGTLDHSAVDDRLRFSERTEELLPLVELELFPQVLHLRQQAEVVRTEKRGALELQIYRADNRLGAQSILPLPDGRSLFCSARQRWLLADEKSLARVCGSLKIEP